MRAIPSSFVFLSLFQQVGAREASAQGGQKRHLPRRSPVRETQLASGSSLSPLIILIHPLALFFQ